MSNTPLPAPWDYCYEWDGPFGTRKFSAASHNGSRPDRSVPIYTPDQMHAHAAAVSADKDAEIANLKTVMVAAAEEIQAHWDAHCDAEGYGPANLMRRLEEGIPSQYGYTAGAFAALQERIKVLEDALRAICSEQDARQGYASVETYDAARAALGDKTPNTQVQP